MTSPAKLKTSQNFMKKSIADRSCLKIARSRLTCYSNVACTVAKIPNLTPQRWHDRKKFGLGVVRARKVAHIQFNPNLCASGESTLLPAVRVTKTAKFSEGPAPSSLQSLAFSRCSLKHSQWNFCHPFRDFHAIA